MVDDEVDSDLVVHPGDDHVCVARCGEDEVVEARLDEAEVLVKTAKG